MFFKKLGWIGYLVSNFDIIVVTVDGRGTGYRGERSVSNYQEYLFKKKHVHAPSTLRRRNFKMQQSQVILDLCLRKTRSGKSHDYSDVIVFRIVNPNPNP